jgi:hypothetical protein
LDASQQFSYKTIHLKSYEDASPALLSSVHDKTIQVQTQLLAPRLQVPLALDKLIRLAVQEYL